MAKFGLIGAAGYVEPRHNVKARRTDYNDMQL